MCLFPCQDENSPLTFPISLLLSPVQGCDDGGGLCVGAGSQRPSHGIVGGVQGRRDPADGSLVLVFGCSPKAFIFPNVSWCGIGAQTSFGAQQPRRQASATTQP